MQDANQPNTPYRLTFATINKTDELVQHTADAYTWAKTIIRNAGDQIDRSATLIPTTFRRPLARTVSALGRSLLAVTDRICQTACNIYCRGTAYVWNRAISRGWPSAAPANNAPVHQDA